MISSVVPDARPLSQIVHPLKFLEISAWFTEVVSAGHRIVVPEITDYEVRRGLLRIPAVEQIRRLDVICAWSYFAPITRPVMHDAAHVWAEARRRGKPFTSDDRLDADAILIAQVRALGDLRQVSVITENIRHLSPYVPARRWQDFEA